MKRIDPARSPLCVKCKLTAGTYHYYYSNYYYYPFFKVYFLFIYTWFWFHPYCSGMFVFYIIVLLSENLNKSMITIYTDQP